MAVTEDDLQNIFGAEKVETQPSQEEMEYLKKRSQLESDMFPLISIDQYEYYYELFCEYGLEEKMLKQVEPDIRHLSRFKPRELLESSFYKRFKDKKLVKEYIGQISRTTNLD